MLTKSAGGVTECLKEITEYIRLSWMESTMWSPESWSVVSLSVQTNNDVEGWHLQLCVKAKKGNLPFYMLLRLLHQEMEMLNINLYLMTEQWLKQH